MVYDIYNYLISDYVHKTNTQYKSHNYSELKNIYNKIIKMGQQTPLYLFHLSDDIETFALNLKDSSLQLETAFSELTKHDETSIYSSKTAVTENNNIVSASIISKDHSNLPDTFELQVHSLAQNQKNISNSFYADSLGLPEGNYHFSIETDENTFEYKLQIPAKIPNQKIMSGIAACINNGNSGIHASILKDKKQKQIQLSLESNQTGTSDGNLIFHIYDSNDKNTSSRGIVSYYNLNQVVQAPQNASFSLNGDEKESLNNQFTLQHTLQLSLNSPSKTPITISYTNDCTKIVSALNDMVDCYNNLIDFADENEKTYSRSSLFLKELQNLISPYEDSFNNIGVTMDEHFHLCIDPIITNKSILNGSFESFFSDENKFTEKFFSKLNKIILNPIEYINKTVVTYPNFLKPNFPSPYVTSIYSGMLFNNYC